MKEDIGVFKDLSVNNIVDYVYKYGSLSFAEKEFNDVDNLIFSSICYFPFEKFENIDTFIGTIQNLCIDYLSWIRFDYVNKYYPNWLKKSIPLAMALLNTKRYSNIKVLKLNVIFSKEKRCQFAAMALKTNNDGLIISFRGTDCTILGWEENFERLYMEEVAGQKYGKDFLEGILKENASLPFLVTGHSKGGNIAISSCLGLDDAYLKNLTCIYSNDGPGFNKDVFNSDVFNKIENKIKLTVLENDIISMIYHNVKPTHIIKSNPSDGLKGHSIYTWLIDNDRMVEAETLSGDSIALQYTFQDWIESDKFNLSQRKLFIKALFKVLDGSNFETIKAMLKEPVNTLLISLKQMKALTKEEKKNALHSGILFFKLLHKNIKRAKKEGKEVSKEFNLIADTEMDGDVKYIENNI